MIIRRHYRACLKQAGNMQSAPQQISEDDRKSVETHIANGQCLTTALYQHKDMLFLYYEALDEALTPVQLFPSLSEQLMLWPEKDGPEPWAYMYQIYYHSIPESPEYWARGEKKTRRGRIAYLLPDKLYSYIYYHKAIVDEGLLEGDQYQSIALHENILFSYFEEPKIFTHIKKDDNSPSKVINEWLAADPESHFDHSLSGKDNFLMIDAIFSMGKVIS